MPRPTPLPPVMDTIARLVALHDVQFTFNECSVRPANTRPAPTATPTDKKAKARKLSRAEIARRLATASDLALFDVHIPRRAQELGIKLHRLDRYVRDGYLRSTGTGYLRTEKPFDVTLGVPHP